MGKEPFAPYTLSGVEPSIGRRFRMRRKLLGIAAKLRFALLFSLLFSAGGQGRGGEPHGRETFSPPTVGPAAGTCGKFGTAVEFVDTPAGGGPTCPEGRKAGLRPARLGELRRSRT